MEWRYGMEIFLKQLFINNVRGLRDIQIEIADGDCRHLLLTGKNGSGKTSVLEGVAHYLDKLSTDTHTSKCIEYIEMDKEEKAGIFHENHVSGTGLYESQTRVQAYFDKLEEMKYGIECTFNMPEDSVYSSFQRGEFLLAFYGAERAFHTVIPRHVEKITLKKNYKITDSPRNEFVKFLVDLKMTEALALTNGKSEKAQLIKQWFRNFEELLKVIFDEEDLQMVFDEETYGFDIQIKGKPKFDFNSLSSGYAAILDIVVDIILRMYNTVQRSFVFNMPGIVLIDEIETHLHIDLQKKIMGFLTGVFPKIQFIVSTHSPFILNSIENVVIYDLEKQVRVENGLTDVSYEGIVEGYYGSSTMSDEINSKIQLYKELVKKETIEDSDLAEIARLEQILDEIPDFLAVEITSEYQQLKLEFRLREDI